MSHCSCLSVSACLTVLYLLHRGLPVALSRWLVSLLCCLTVSQQSPHCLPVSLSSICLTVLYLSHCGLPVSQSTVACLTVFHLTNCLLPVSLSSNGLTVLHLSDPHLPGHHGEALGQLDAVQKALPPVADADLLVEDGSRGDSAVLCDGLQSQHCVLRDRQTERETGCKARLASVISSYFVFVCAHLYREETPAIVLVLGQPGQDGVGVVDPPL